MAISIPCKRRYPITYFDPKFFQRIRKLLGSAMAFAVGVAMNIAFHSARDDFRSTVITISMLNQTGNEQRLAHHSAHQWALGVLRHIVSDGIFL
jgi:hypothetical protein